jgi:protein TonB
MRGALGDLSREALVERPAAARPASTPDFVAVLEIPHANRRDQGRVRRWTVSAGVVTLLYLALAGAACWRFVHAAETVAPAPMEAMVVELVPSPTAPTAPLMERPAGPLQDARDAALARSPSDRPVPLSAPKPDGFETPPVERTTAARGETSSQAPPVAQSTAPPSVLAPPGPSLAARETSAAREQNAAVTWQGLLLGRLKQYRRYPRRAESAGQEGVVQVRFTVDRHGAVLSSRIDRGSGYPLLDDETLATVRRASPMPPPPSEIKGDPVDVVVPVEFSLRKG